MRKVTKQAVNALMNKASIRIGNTEVVSNGAICGMYLHGNLIAERNIESGKISVSNCGWFSNTTKERLNGIPGVNISQRKGVWYLNGKEWDGSLTAV